MSPEVLFVKNMVCRRCILAVEDLLRNLEIPYQKVITGEIFLSEKLIPQKQTLLASHLSKIGLELIDNSMTGMVEKIKQLVIKKARNEVDEKEIKMTLSGYLTRQMYHEYTYLSSFFSSVEGRTIESYLIQQRIEKVKELLVYNEMTLTAIANELEYSSVAHLSYQFKQITGLTPTYFKKVGSTKRKLLDQI
jgi:AraC family transcriptional regulator